MIKTYSELVKLDSFVDRFNYLKIGGVVGKETFGFDRYLNQILYNSPEWKMARRNAIIRDNGCDLGVEGYEIHGIIMVHHINPITLEEVINRDPKIFDLEFLITTTLRTHNAVHYGDESLLFTGPVIRTPNDTCPWRK